MNSPDDDFRALDTWSKMAGVLAACKPKSRRKRPASDMLALVGNIEVSSTALIQLQSMHSETLGTSIGALGQHANTGRMDGTPVRGHDANQLRHKLHAH